MSCLTDNRCTDRLNSHAKGGVTDQMEVVAVLYTGVDAEQTRNRGGND